MSDKISTLIEVVVSLIRSIAGNLGLVLLAIGFLALLVGAVLSVGGIIVLGIFRIAIGILVYLIVLLRR